MEETILKLMTYAYFALIIIGVLFALVGIPAVIVYAFIKVFRTRNEPSDEDKKWDKIIENINKSNEQFIRENREVDKYKER